MRERGGNTKTLSVCIWAINSHQIFSTFSYEGFMAERSRYRIVDEAQVEIEGVSCVNLRINTNGKSEHFDVIQWDANEAALEMSRNDIIWDFICVEERKTTKINIFNSLWRRTRSKKKTCFSLLHEADREVCKFFVKFSHLFFLFIMILT